MNNTFNQQIWSELLKVEEIQSKKDQQLTGPDIQKLLGLSNRTAYAYLFALRNRNRITREGKDSLRIHKLASLVKEKERENKVLKAEMERLEASLNFMYAIQVTEHHNWTRLKIKQDASLREECTAISLCSDLHADEVVDKEVVDGINEYNRDIFIQRFNRYFSRLIYVIRMQRKAGQTIKNLVLGFLGDLISGYIHEELMENNSMSPTEAVSLLQDLIIAGIKTLAEDGEFANIIIIGVRGNHGRTSTKKKFSTGYKNSYEWLMYKNIEKAFTEYLTGYNNVFFVIPKSEFAYLNIYDKTIGFSHGDHFYYLGGVGGVMIPLMRWLYKINDVIPTDMRCIGHWHSYLSLPNCLVNGSGIGYNAYTMGKGFKPELPKMQLQLLDSHRGFTANIPIILDDFNQK
jgi:hypothetical protein